MIMNTKHKHVCMTHLFYEKHWQDHDLYWKIVSLFIHTNRYHSANFLKLRDHVTDRSI
uniref:Uncharacterized protein n=1 Tax=Arundo donax TaxID=35708 RepID=A0A0A8ZER9_ARUDO